MAALVERLTALAPSPALVVLEATGGMEVRLAAALAAAGLPVAVVNPRRVRAFARATGRLAKTDRQYAKAIARFAEAVRPSVRPMPDEATRHLGALWMLLCAIQHSPRRVRAYFKPEPVRYAA